MQLQDLSIFFASKDNKKREEREKKEGERMRKGGYRRIWLIMSTDRNLNEDFSRADCSFCGPASAATSLAEK